MKGCCLLIRAKAMLPLAPAVPVLPSSQTVVTVPTIVLVPFAFCRDESRLQG